MNTYKYIDQIRVSALLGILITCGLGTTLWGHGSHAVGGDFVVDDGFGDAVPWTHLDANNDPDNFQFVIVADRTGGMRRGIFDAAVDKINLMQPEFVVSVGDLIPGKRDTDSNELLDTMWDEFNSMVNRLEMPFFYVSGNHDIYNSLMGEQWANRFGPSYYSFKYADVLFIILNTEFINNHQNKWPGMHEAQLDWLKGVISKEVDVRWTVLLLHEPMWNYKHDPVIPDEYRDIHERWLEVERAFERKKLTLFAGHRHHYKKEIRNNHEYFTLATTGAGNKLRGIDYGEFDHFLWVTMTDDGPVIANLLMDGVLDPNIVPTVPPYNVIPQE
ncbi:MAG: metallophosphoesterase [Puniceicoccaceae bacterium]